VWTVKKVSQESKKASEKTDIVSARAQRAIRPRKHVPAAHVLSTFDDLLDDFNRRFRESIWAPWELEPIEPYVTEFPAREAFADLADAGNKFVVHAEVPGIPKDKVNVTVTKDDVEISAEAGTEKEEKKKGYVFRERGYSSFYKRIAFPEEVVPEKAESTLKDGVLEVEVPKKTPTPKPKKHKVAVK
jgi:HSP20 family molecular chaperone IbpA